MRIYLILLCAFIAQQASAQHFDKVKNGVHPSIFNSAGGTYDPAGSYYRYEWSLGELVMIEPRAPADSSVLVTAGVLQPCTEKPGNTPKTLLFVAGDYRLFPNPTSRKFELNFFVKEAGQMRIQLIDPMGKILETRNFHYDGCCRIEHFDLGRYPDGIYYVVADFDPIDNRAGDNLDIIRHGGMKVIKISK